MLAEEKQSVEQVKKDYGLIFSGPLSAENIFYFLECMKNNGMIRADFWYPFSDKAGRVQLLKQGNFVDYELDTSFINFWKSFTEYIDFIEQCIFASINENNLVLFPEYKRHYEGDESNDKYKFIQVYLPGYKPGDEQSVSEIVDAIRNPRELENMTSIAGQFDGFEGTWGQFHEMLRLLTEQLESKLNEFQHLYYFKINTSLAQKKSKFTYGISDKVIRFKADYITFSDKPYQDMLLTALFTMNNLGDSIERSDIEEFNQPHEGKSPRAFESAVRDINKNLDKKLFKVLTNGSFLIRDKTRVSFNQAYYHLIEMSN